jgi:murein DD-endopeptidase MepM/ murein hydrolase activator NlpD
MSSRNFRFYVLLLLVVSATIGFSSASSFAFPVYKYFLHRTAPSLYWHLPNILGDKSNSKKDTVNNRIDAIYNIANAAIAANNTATNKEHADRGQIESYLKNLSKRLIKVAVTQPTEADLALLQTPVDVADKNYKTVDKVLYVDNHIASRYEAEQYLTKNPAVDLDLDKHPNMPFEEVVEQILYINGEIANRQQAQVYLAKHADTVLDINLHPQPTFASGTMASVGSLKIVDDMLYVDGRLSNLAEAKAYIAANPSARINLQKYLSDSEKSISFDAVTRNADEIKVVDRVLYINNDLATRQEAEDYVAQNPTLKGKIDLKLQPDWGQEDTETTTNNPPNASAQTKNALQSKGYKVIEGLLYIDGEIASRQQAKDYLKANSNYKGKINLNYQPEDATDAQQATAAITDMPTPSLLANNEVVKTKAIKGNGFEIFDRLLYINGEIATQQQAKDYIAKNPKLKGKLNLQMQPNWDAAEPTLANNNQQLLADNKPATTSNNIKGVGYEVFEKLLYIDGEIATQQQTKDYIAKNPKLKGKIDLQMQPNWDAATPQLANLTDTQDNADIENAAYEIVDNVLYIDGDIATRAEANSYIKKNPKDRGKVKILLQPEFIDDYDPTQMIAQMPKPDLVLSNPEIIDGKLFINGKPASTKEKNAFEASTGIMIRYDKMIGDYEKTLITKNPNAFDATFDRDRTIAPINPGEKILLSKNYDEAVPCYAHYDGIWNNDNIFPYHYDLTKMPQQVEFLLTHGVDADFSIPSPGDITSGFGRRWGRHHNGIDIDLETGDQVRAAFEGKVRCALYSPSFGYLVVIRHYNGLETFYAHLSSLLVRANDVVNAGTVIGLGGTTGHSTGSHLHFEVRYKGHPFNPALLINFDSKRLRTNSFTVDRHFFSSDNPYVIDEGGGNSHVSSRSTAAKKAKKTSAKYHSVRKGDTLDEIADRNGTSVRKLCALNRISSRTTLAIGRKLRVK